ncbi:MDR family MFS transporter [Rhodococcus sp. NBC_00294]|uniref:MDR family MFS transporter n=1 Tax=Rhodococcus sp. NBC_00294 TaxID=2976004 RepID=UPI002E2DD82D|nr:MDR family MFS transporter [Rhodococcus sp. NBC_00294]
MTDDTLRPATGAGSPQPDTSGDTGQFTHRQIMTIISGLMLGMFLAALDQTIVSTSIRTIADDLQGFSVQAWVTTAYLITATISTPLYGKLSDIYGRKQFFLTAITIFVIGSALCGFATSMYQLAAFRAFQGLGAGGLFSLALTIVGDIVPPRERAKYQGYFLAVFGTSSVLGPVIGGVLSGQSEILNITGWRWVFFVNVPIGIVALFVVAKVLNLPRRHGSAVVDWGGAAALAVGLVPLLIIAEQGRTWGWGSGRAMICYTIGVLGIAAFIAIEIRMTTNALIPMRFFRNSTFSVGLVLSVITGAAMFGGITLLPQYLQVVKGSSPTLAGFQMLPLVLGIMVASIFSGQMISRTGHYRPYPIIGTTLMTVCMFAFSFIEYDTPLWMIMIAMFGFGFGLGNLMQPLTLAIQNALPPQDMGVSTSSATFFRQIGGTIGVAVFLSLLFSRVTDAIASALRSAAETPEFREAVGQAASSTDPAVSGLAQGLVQGNGSAAGGILDDTSFIQKLPDAVAAPFQIGFSDAMDSVFVVAGFVLALAFVINLFYKEVPLRTQGGLAAQASERTASRDTAE